MRKVCIVFDLDGTLFDTKRGIIFALNYVLNHYGKKTIPIEQEDLYIGPPIKQSLMEYSGFNEENAIKASNLYRSVYINKFIHFTKIYKEAINVLDHLKRRNVLLGIATMKTQLQVEKLFSIFDIQDYFTYIEFAKVDCSYTKEEMLKKIKSSNSDIHNYTCYYIGDTKGDLVASRESGFNFIYAQYGYGNIDKSDLNSIHDIKELTKIF